MLRIGPVFLVLFLLGCGGALTQGRGYIQVRETQEEKKVEETQTRHTGAPALIKKGDRTYNIESDGPVTITPGSDSEDTANDLKNLSPEQMIALAKIYMNQSNNTTLESESSASFELHKKWSTLSSVVIIALVILLLVLRSIAASMRRGLQSVGIDPKMIGVVIPKLFNTAVKAKDKVERNIEYLDRRIGENNIEAGIKSELTRQKNDFLELRNQLNKIEEHDNRMRRE